MNAYLAEFIGTSLLVLMGNGVVANVCLNKTKAQSSGWIVITSAWAFAVYVAVVVAGPYSGAHLNPAVTLGLSVIGKFDSSMIGGYILAQIMGAMFGSLLVYVFYRDHFHATEDKGLKRACFCTEPAIRKYSSNFINEAIGTFVLLFVIFYLTGANINFPDNTTAPIGLGSLGALPVTILVWAIGLSLGGTTGYAINPARDLGPRLTLGLLGKVLNTPADWQYSWVPILGPITGAVLAGMVYNLLM